MENHQIRQLIRQELPAILQRDPEMRAWVLSLTQEQYADKQETESRFDRLLDELRRDREEQTRKWEENQQELRAMREEQARKWEENRQELRAMREENQQELQAAREEQTRKWEENQQELQAAREEQTRKWEENQQELRAMREEQTRKWEENQQELQAAREEQNRKWEEQNRKWEEQNRKWDENQATLNAMLEEIHALSRKHDSTLGALGARWGLYTEQSFRGALRGILEDSFDIEVVNVTEFDDAGEVFGRPDQVELDVIIQNGLLILCEIKSSMSKSDMYAFERKVRFYEKHHNRKADRVLVISPMVDRQAQDVARKLDIEVYSYARDVDPAVFV